jgi:RIO kinase 2
MIDEVADPGALYAELMDMIVRLAQRGLIHGDFNEFNILIKEKTVGDKVQVIPILIDFPQTVSTNHANAQYYFDRDVECVRRYFERRFKYTSDEPGPFFADALKGADPERRLDVEVEASGFSKKMGKDLDRFIEASGVSPAEAEVDGEKEVGGEGEGDRDEDEDEDEDVEVDSLSGPGDEAEAELAKELGGLAVEDAPAQPYSRADFGLEPLEMPQEHDAAAAAAVKTKKKASGWAI